MKEFLYKVMGEPSVLAEGRIEDLMEIAGIDTREGYVIKFINHLCSLSFLGRETKLGHFEYEFDFDSDEKIIALSSKLNTGNYKIHNAFIPYLECSDYVAPGDIILS